MGYQANQAWSVFFTEITQLFGRSWRVPFPEIGFQKKEASDSIPFDFKEATNLLVVSPKFLDRSPKDGKKRPPSSVDVLAYSFSLDTLKLKIESKKNPNMPK